MTVQIDWLDNKSKLKIENDLSYPVGMILINGKTIHFTNSGHQFDEIR